MICKQYAEKSHELRGRLAAAWRHLFSAAVVACGLLVVAGCEDPPVERLVAEAAALRQKGDFPGAALQLKAALAKDPKNIPARLLAVDIYLDLDRGDAALGLLLKAQQDGADVKEIAKLRAQAEFVARRYQDVVDETTNLPEGLSHAAKASLLAYRGGALAALGRTPAAQAAFEDALAADPHSVDVRLIAGRLAMERGDIEEARSQLAAALRDAPKDRRVRRLDGDVAYTARDFPAAAKTYQKILDAEPWNELARGQLAAAQVAQDKLSEAVANLGVVLGDPGLNDVPKHPILHYTRALAAFRQRDYAVAQTNAAAVVTRVPAYEPARLIAGASSYALREYEQAYYYLSPYVSQNPDDVAARKLLAATQLRLGHPGDAAKTLSPAREQAAQDPELLELIGVAAARGGDMPTARRYLNMALDRRPEDPLLRTRLGLADIAAGDTAAAIGNLERVINAHPGVSLPQLPLFVAFMQMKDYEKALATAEQLIKSAPSEPIGQLLAAAVYLAKGDVESGRAALLKAREIRPGDIAANDNLAKLAIVAGKIDEARRYYRDSIAANPQSKETYIALAQLDARNGRLAEAEEVLAKGVAANPADPELIVALLRHQLTAGEAEKALSGAEAALKKFQRNPALLDIAGEAQLALRRLDDALSTFKDLVDVAPDMVAAHIGLAKAYLAQYAPANPQWPAISEATAAVKLDPQDLGAKFVLAQALTMHGRIVDASPLVKELKGVKPQDPDVLELEGRIARAEGRAADASDAIARAEALRNGGEQRRLAQAELRLGHADQAARILTDWLAANPSDSATRKVWAEICVNTGRLPEAVAQYGDLVKQDPKDPMLRNNLAWVLSRLGRADEALPHAQAAVGLAPGSVEFLDTLGAILLQVGRPEEAMVPLKTAWNRASDRPDVGFHFSQALAGAGRNDEALAVLRRVLKDQDPTFADRSRAQELLRQLGG